MQAEVALDGAAVRDDDRVRHAAHVVNAEARGREGRVAVGSGVAVLAGQVGAVLKVPVRAPTSAKKQRARKTAAKAAASLDDYQFTEIDGELYAVRSMLDLLRIEYGKQAVTALSAEGDEDDLSDDGAHRRAGFRSVGARRRGCDGLSRDVLRRRWGCLGVSSGDGRICLVCAWMKNLFCESRTA